MNVREIVFWFIDGLKGGKIRRNYQNNRGILKREIKELKKSEYQLEVLIKHVNQTVPYYRDQCIRSLTDFPVINKSIIKENPDLFISRNYKKDQLTSVTTSGSTGTPFTIYQDSQKRARHAADNIFFNELAGTSVGSKFYYFRVWNTLVNKSFIKRFATNIVQVEASNLSDDHIEKILLDLSSVRGRKSLLAFASTHEVVFLYLKKCRKQSLLNDLKKANIVSIISMSEALPEETRKGLSEFFGVDVVSRYSNMENGFIGQQPVHERFYILNEGSFRIELLDLNSDAPVPIGAVGRIVVTDLYNYAMPLLRYDTGDLGVFEKVEWNGVERIVLSSIEGRVVDLVYNTKGEMLSPHTVTNTMWKYPYLKQWQFIQEGKKSYRLVINGKFDQEEDLRKNLFTYIGDDALITFDYVDEIPVLASGKRKKIVNKYTS